MRPAIPLALLGAIAVSDFALAGEYIREHQYDARVRSDDEAVNVSLVSNRWPDCATLESTIESIFRIEGVADRAASSDQSRALALWKWFRIMVSATGGAYAYEGPNLDRLVWDPHKILTVYGHHQCDGQSWAMVPLWRAAGYMAFDECHNGHTIAALRYRDDDGQTRYHNFDPQGRFYYWDDLHKRVGTWSMPVFTGHVFRHVTTPLKIHSLRTSLRLGESIERNWTNTGHVVPSGRGDQIAKMNSYYDYAPGRIDGIYAAVGEEAQTLVAETQPETFTRQLADDSGNTACSPPSAGKATLHPAKPAELAAFVYRLPPPYVATDATIEATLVKTAADDVCRLAISRDGGPWRTVFEKTDAGVETVKIDVGRSARAASRPDVYTAYEIRVRGEFKAAGDVRSAGMNSLKVTAWRQLNKRTLPNLMPGENVFRVDAESLPDDRMLKLTLRYERAGRAVENVYWIAQPPFYFTINEPFELRKIANYDKDFNNEAVRMIGYRLELVPPTLSNGARLVASTSEPPAEAWAKFKLPAPHPADMTDRKLRTGEQVETSILQTNGFLPQSDARPKDDPAAVAELLKRIDAAGDFKKFVLVSQLGDFAGTQDELLKRLPAANIDETVYVLKALARVGDAKAIDPLLAKWRAGMKNLDRLPPGESAGGAPGGRYIPDTLAAIVQRLDSAGTPAEELKAIRNRCVLAMLEPLPKLRFDFRFHIAHALGVLGKGSGAAEQALQDLSVNDPFPPVREQAREALKKLGVQ